MIPGGLYPEWAATSKVQRITVPACLGCNGGRSDDEAHFKVMLAIAGETNRAVEELWGSSIERGFKEKDGLRRLLDVHQQMKPVVVDGQRRYKVYPAEDPRVMRVIRKIIRGLSHHHGLESAVPDDRVWADLQIKHPIPQHLLDGMQRQYREPGIVEYGYEVVKDDDGVWTAWLLTFFERRTFIGLVLPRGIRLPMSGS